MVVGTGGTWRACLPRRAGSVPRDRRKSRVGLSIEQKGKETGRVAGGGTYGGLGHIVWAGLDTDLFDISRASLFTSAEPERA